MAARKLIFRLHAVQRMFARGIDTDHVHNVIENGRVIRSYDDDQPYPSRLMLAFAKGRPIHVVAADVPDSEETVIITAYEPGAAHDLPNLQVG